MAMRDTILGLLAKEPAHGYELRTRLITWRDGRFRSDSLASVSASLRGRTWDHMAADIAAAVRGTAS